MAHLAAAWPDQVLCKENKRKALAEQQRRWMEQRSQELLRQQSSREEQQGGDSDSDSLENLNGFLADVGRALGDESPRPVQAASTLYEETNSILRNLHLERRQGAGALHKAEPALTSSPVHEAAHDASLLLQNAAAPPIRLHRRSAAQRAAAERLVQPQQQAERRVERHAPAPLIGGEAFYKHQQEGIRAYRRAYDARVAHLDAHSDGKESAPLAHPRPTDAIGALAYDNATRHLAPASELARGSSSGSGVGSLRRSTPSAAPAPDLSAGSSLRGFMSEKTAGRRGGRAGRSGSIHATLLQAAKDRGPML